MDWNLNLLWNQVRHSDLKRKGWANEMVELLIEVGLRDWVAWWGLQDEAQSWAAQCIQLSVVPYYCRERGVDPFAVDNRRRICSTWEESPSLHSSLSLLCSPHLHTHLHTHGAIQSYDLVTLSSYYVTHNPCEFKRKKQNGSKEKDASRMKYKFIWFKRKSNWIYNRMSGVEWNSIRWGGMEWNWVWCSAVVLMEKVRTPA